MPCDHVSEAAPVFFGNIFSLAVKFGVHMQQRTVVEQTHVLLHLQCSTLMNKAPGKEAEPQRSTAYVVCS